MARRGSSTKQLKEKRKSFLKVKTKSARGRTKGRAIEGKKITSRKKGMSNIPAGEGTVNNPNYGKKGDLSMFKTKKKIVKKETPKKETPKKETPKKETPKKETPKKETPKKEIVKKETPKKETPKKVIKSTTKGGPVKSGVEYARSKGDDLAGYRRGPNKALGKDTRITKELKKSGFTEDRLARLRKKHAEFKAKRRKKKTKLKVGG
jgi:penicillin-insensitive murein endopeptidase